MAKNVCALHKMVAIHNNSQIHMPLLLIITIMQGFYSLLLFSTRFQIYNCAHVSCISDRVQVRQRKMFESLKKERIYFENDTTKEGKKYAGREFAENVHLVDIVPVQIEIFFLNLCDPINWKN